MLVLSSIVFGQNYKKAFKAIEDKNYSAAKVVFIQAQNNVSSKSLGDYGLAVIARASSLRQDDLFNANKLIISADNSWPNCDENLKSKYELYFTKEKIDLEKKEIDNKLFAMVKSSNEIKNYQRFIDECPQSSFHQEAINLRNSTAYQLALTYNNIPAWNTFLKQYPNSAQFEKAQSNLYEIAWQQCNTDPSIGQYADFINQYPNAPQATEAQNKMIDLEFQRALAVNTNDAFRTFIDKYPMSDQAATLRQKKVLNAYSDAKKFQTIALCNRFIEFYPNTEYTSEIIQLRDSLAYLEAKNLNTSASYQNFVSQYPSAIQVPQAMTYMTTLLYSRAELMNLRDKNKVIASKLKSVTAYNVDIADTNIKIIEEERKYDAFGNCIYHFDQVLPSVKNITKYSFDELGEKLIQKQIFLNDEIQSHTSYFYDERGLISSSKTECNSNCLDSTGLYQDTLIYDEKRNLISQQSFNSNAILIESHAFSYDVKGNKIGEETMQLIRDSLYKFVITYNYDGKNQLIQKSKKDLNGVVLTISSYSYDALGNVTTSTHYDASGTLMRTYFYDARGLMKNEIVKFEEYSGKEIVKLYLYRFL